MSRSRGVTATSIASLADDDQLAAFVEGLVLGAFGFDRRSSANGDDAHEPQVVLTDLTPSRNPVIEAATARAAASWRARTYALTPSNEKGPINLERWAEEAAARSGLALEVWDDTRLVADGFGGIVAVGRGSAYESRFLRMDYEPAGADSETPHLVLVGKGITFDSGGISIKPSAAMMTMKRDMTGAGVVIAVMGALRELGVRVKVTGLVASAENAFGAASMRPGDIVAHYGGRTSEVGNTDAEGRLVLADALAYADRHLNADAVVDIATLTGAGKVALGTSLGALFANDDALAEALHRAGAIAGEPLWRLPLTEEYESLLDNTFADATNAAGGPGAITAALFLQHFAGDGPWAHLDIASVGDSSTDAFEYSLGATGFGARLLLRWLEGVSRRISA
ncbi:MAG: leucyl aminopeptidase [Propionibacteriales bacterium]|nr:leucyl aminopeptidase [Propionibacteriales bacterium]